MATKAERFKYDTERSGTRRSKPPKKKAGVALRKPSRGRKAVFEKEEVAPSATRSRKSTRKSKHRQKAATTLTSRMELIQDMPQRRHDRGRPAPRAAH